MPAIVTNELQDLQLRSAHVTDEVSPGIMDRRSAAIRRSLSIGAWVCRLGPKMPLQGGTHICRFRYFSVAGEHAPDDRIVRRGTYVRLTTHTQTRHKNTTQTIYYNLYALTRSWRNNHSWRRTRYLLNTVMDVFKRSVERTRFVRDLMRLRNARATFFFYIFCHSTLL